MILFLVVVVIVNKFYCVSQCFAMIFNIQQEYQYLLLTSMCLQWFLYAFQLFINDFQDLEKICMLYSWLQWLPMILQWFAMFDCWLQCLSVMLPVFNIGFNDFQYLDVTLMFHYWFWNDSQCFMNVSSMCFNYVYTKPTNILDSRTSG